MPDIYYVNGRFTDHDDAVVHVEDRGFQFGDGVYEVLRSYNQTIFCLDEHLARLSRSLEAIDISSALPLKLKDICYEALIRSRYTDALIYIQITRGVAKRSHVPPAGMTPTVVLIVYKTPVLVDSLWENGVKTILLPDIRWANCFIKTLQLLPNTLALTKAAGESALEAILHKNGIVTECCSSNVFMVKNKTVKTHPADETVLHGVSRKTVLDILNKHMIAVQEKAFTVDELLNADEVFITNTLVEVMPVTLIGETAIGNGHPGPITTLLVHAFRQLTQ